MLDQLLLLAMLAGPAPAAAPASTPNAAPFHRPCAPPLVGDWVVVHDCILAGQAAAPRNVIVQPGITLVLAPGAALDIDFDLRHLRVRQGARVVVRQGARVH